MSDHLTEDRVRIIFREEVGFIKEHLVSKVDYTKAIITLQVSVGMSVLLSVYAAGMKVIPFIRSLL